jgi:hypothetical protein
MNAIFKTVVITAGVTIALVNLQNGLEAVGFVKKAEVLKDAIVQCRDSATLNQHNPFGYQVIQQSEACNDTLNPYNVAFPDAPVPNKPNVTSGGKPPTGGKP